MKRKNVLKKVVTLIVIAMVVSMPIANLAHSGRTDSSGGHKDKNNVSGLGGYHYHCGGHPAHLHTGGVCPYSAPAPASAASSSSSSKTTSTKSTTPAKVNPTSVEIDEDDFEILIGESKTLSVIVLPSNAANKTVTWKSSDKEVVMIDSEGELVAMGVGEATITATTSNGKNTSINVTVNPIKVSEINLSETELNLKPEDKTTITAEVFPENATDKTIEWFSENPEIVSVEDGIITAIATGATKVICKSKDGIESEVNIVVKEEKIIEEENTVEVVASIDDNSSSTSSSDSDAVLGLATLGAMVGIPVYLHKKKKSK